MPIEGDGSEGFNRQPQRYRGGGSLHMCRVAMVKSPGSKGHGKELGLLKAIESKVSLPVMLRDDLDARRRMEAKIEK